jgi:hypothetical protein
MRPVGNLLLRYPWITRNDLFQVIRIAKSCLKSPKCKSPAAATHSPYRCLQRFSEALDGFSPPVKSDPVHSNPENNHRNLRITVQFHRYPVNLAIAQRSAPTAGSQGKAYHTPNAIP